MATHLAIDSEPFDRALEVSGERTNKAAVTNGLQVFLVRRQSHRVADPFGKPEWDHAFDHKAGRSWS